MFSQRKFFVVHFFWLARSRVTLLNHHLFFALEYRILFCFVESIGPIFLLTRKYHVLVLLDYPRPVSSSLRFARLGCLIRLPIRCSIFHEWFILFYWLNSAQFSLSICCSVWCTPVQYFFAVRNSVLFRYHQFNFLSCEYMILFYFTVATGPSFLLRVKYLSLMSPTAQFSYRSRSAVASNVFFLFRCFHRLIFLLARSLQSRMPHN